MDRAEQVRQILSSRGLTLYRVSEQSAQIFGRSTRFFVPHNLYYDVANPSLVPTIHQMLSLSHITGYRLSDWLAVFGFDLDLISRLRLLIPRLQTTLLDSTVYDTNAWIPWFVERERNGPVPPITPLGQFLASAGPRRAAELLALNQRRFVYGRVGKADVRAFPHLAPGSIVRVNVKCPEELFSETRTYPEQRLFFVEHNSGWTCSQITMLGKDRILLRSQQRPCAEIELTLGKEARIVGVIDAEIRQLEHQRCVRMKGQSIPAPASQLVGGANVQDGLKDLLRRSRTRVGLSFREASSVSRWIASTLSDELYFAAASTLSDYEILSKPPRHIQKVITLCLLYCINFDRFLRISGVPIDQAGREPMPDELVPRQAPSKNVSPQTSHVVEKLREHSGLLGSLIHQWEEIPLFLSHSLSEITGLKNFSLPDMFWVGGVEAALHPWLINAAFVAVNRRVKKPGESTAKTTCDQPLYLVLKRDGSYLCGRCTLDEGNLVVHSYPGGPVGLQRFRNGTDAEIVGQVTTILRRLL